MMYTQFYKLTILYNFMLLINLNAIYLQHGSSQELMPSEILCKSCRKNVSQQQNKDGPLLIDIFTFIKTTDHPSSLKGF